MIDIKEKQQLARPKDGYHVIITQRVEKEESRKFNDLSLSLMRSKTLYITSPCLGLPPQNTSKKPSNFKKNIELSPIPKMLHRTASLEIPNRKGLDFFDCSLDQSLVVSDDEYVGSNQAIVNEKFIMIDGHFQSDEKDIPKSSAEHEEVKICNKEIETNLSMSDFGIINQLGSGSFADVDLVKKRINGKLYALKKIKKNALRKENKEYQALVEVDILKRLNTFKSSSFIKFYSTFEDEDYKYLVLEYAPGGKLSDYIAKQKKLPKEQIAFFTAEIINILELMHTNNIAHRDLKPENLLLSKDGHIKCIDFGTAKILNSNERMSELFGELRNLSELTRSHSDTFVGTILYVSPEVIEDGKSRAPADLWALGCLIYQMATGHYAFKDDNNLRYNMYEKIKKVDVSYPEDIDIEIKDLLQKLLVRNPALRLGADIIGPENGYEKLKSHSLFKNLDFKKIHWKKPPSFNILEPYLKNKAASPTKKRLGVRQKAYTEFRSCNELERTQTILREGEKRDELILTGRVLKRCPKNLLYYQERQLLLKPDRLEYYNQGSELKRKAKLLSSSGEKFSFSIPGRQYVFKSIEHSAKKWVEEINAWARKIEAD